METGTDVSSILDGFIGMSDTALYIGLLALVMPIVLGLIFKATWSADLKAGLAIVACFAASAGLLYLQDGAWDTMDWAKRGLVTAAMTAVFYRLYGAAIPAWTERTDDILRR